MAYNPSNPNGQATMANSEPVVIASNQTAIPVTDNGGSLTIDGSVSVSNFPATQNVSVTNASLPVTDNGGSLTIDGSVSVSNFPATQPISGTVTANAGTGTMNVSVQNASIPVTDNGGSLTIDGSVSVSNFPATQPVSGTITANAGTGTMNVSVQNASIPVTDNGGSLTIDGSVSVSNFPATQPISGTVTANAGTGTFGVSGSVALNAGTNYVGKVRLTDGTTDAEVVPLTGYNAQAVAIVDGSGNQLTSFGGGVQYVDGDSPAEITGTVALGFDGTSVQALSTTSGGLLNVSDGGGSLTIDGTVVATQASSTAFLVQISDGTSNVPIDAAHSDGDANTENHIDVGAKGMVFNGTSWDRMRGDTTGQYVVGNVAHDVADTGNPVKIGFQAEASTLPTAVASGDRVNGIADVFGRQLIGTIDASMQVWKSANYTTTQTGASMWTPSSGKKICVTYLAISSYATTAGRVLIWFGATADTTYTAGTDQLVWAGSFAPSANAKPGAIVPLPFGITAVTADHQLRITTDAAISLDVTIYGYEC